jgi:hypothetical protein
LAKAQGEFFVLMGDDDKMEPDYLEEFLKLIARYPKLDVYHCRSKIIDQDSQPIMLTSSWPEYETVYDSIWHKLFSGRLQFISDFVYRTEVLRRNGGFYYLPLAWASDDISSYIAIGDKGIAHTNKPVFNYRKHSSTLSMTGNGELKMKSVLQKQKWFAEFLSKKPLLDNDLITYNNICLNIKKRIQKEKVQTIKHSMNKNFFINCIKWFCIYKRYDISLAEVIYSIMANFKTRIVRKNYH